VAGRTGPIGIDLTAAAGNQDAGARPDPLGGQATRLLVGDDIDTRCATP
jgi:hypothetical protein